MEWICVKISTIPEEIDNVCTSLIEIGVTNVEIVDGVDFLNFLENNKTLWDYVDDSLMQQMENAAEVRAYVTNNAVGRETISLIREAMSQFTNKSNLKSAPQISLNTVDEEDWANNWKQYFKPIEVGEKLLVCPEWESPPVTNRVVFKINPGMCFGAGSHATTQLCLEFLEQLVFPGAQLLDVGCGSGILSCVATLLGAKSVAVDIDPNAEIIAKQNAELNNIEYQQILCGDIIANEKLRTSLGRYDIVVANIVADVIIELSRVVGPLLKDNGRFIISGIITERESEVIDKMEGFNLLEKKQRNGWVCFCLKRPYVIKS